MDGTGDRPRCRNHLGQDPEIVRANYFAQRQAALLFDEARRAAEREGLPLIDPLRELHALAGEVLAWRDICRKLVGELPEIRYKAGVGGEQVRAEVALYERSLERAEKILSDLVKLGIEERLAKLTAKQVDEVMGLIDRTLVRLGVDPEQPEVAGLIAAELRELAPARVRR
jgi:hypothetical protein